MREMSSDRRCKRLKREESEESAFSLCLPRAALALLLRSLTGVGLDGAPGVSRHGVATREGEEKATKREREVSKQAASREASEASKPTGLLELVAAPATRAACLLSFEARSMLYATRESRDRENAQKLQTATSEHLSAGAGEWRG